MFSGNINLMDNLQRQESVWNLVKENVPNSELPEIRSVLGDTLIDTYIELYAEVEIWEKIWQEIQCSERSSRPEAPLFPLADPPAIKELLKAEIQLLLLTLRERAARQGRDEEELMAQYNPSVVSYALGTSRQGSPASRCETKNSSSRPPSSLSHNGSRPVSSLSSSSSCEEEIQALRHKLNISHIDEVVAHLRSVLTEECESLKRDVHVLQEHIEMERASKQTGPASPDPSLAELKEERRLIQRDLQAQSLMSSSLITDKRSTTDPQFHPRETSELALAANDLELLKPSKSAVPSGICSSFLKPYPPRDTDHMRTGLSLTQRDKPTPGTLQTPVSSTDTAQNGELDLDSSLSDRTFSSSSLEIDLPPLNDRSVESQSSISNYMLKESNYRRHSVRASAFRLVPAASVSGSTKDLMKMVVTRDSDLGHLQPTPPAVQKAASRGQRRDRKHLCVRLPESLVSSP